MPIPRRILQTHRDDRLMRELRETWRDHHPDYDHRFFDDAACRDFVAARRPDVLASYDALPLPVQKADLFRYVAVHELGGLYTDVDTECRAPLHDYLDLSRDALVVCAEMRPSDWPAGVLQYAQLFCWPRQLGQWTFAAPAGHPALARMIERICWRVGQLTAAELAAASAFAPFTLELTGPRLFTQVVDEFLCASRVGEVIELDRLAWGAQPAEQADPRLAGLIRVRHRFAASWKPARPAARPRLAPAAVRFDIRC